MRKWRSAFDSPQADGVLRMLEVLQHPGAALRTLLLADNLIGETDSDQLVPIIILLSAHTQS